MYLKGHVCGASTGMKGIQVGAFSSPRVSGHPVSLTTTDDLGHFRLAVPPGSWHLHAVGGVSGGRGFLQGTVWGSYGGIYGQGRPVAVCHTPVTNLKIDVSRLWRDLTHVPHHRQPALADEQRLLVYVTREELARRLSDARISDLEHRIGLSRSRLSSLFRRATGLTMVQYRNRVRLEVAKALLVRTDADVLHVALEVGYSTAAALARVFQTSIGVSPAEFRRLARVASSQLDPVPGTAAGLTAVAMQTVAALCRDGGCLTGEVTYDGLGQGAAIYLFAIPRPDPTAYPVVWTALPNPGPFTLQDVPPGRYFLTAFFCRKRMQVPSGIRSIFAHGTFGSESGALGDGLPVIVTQGKTVGNITIRLVDGDRTDYRPASAVRALLAEAR